MQKKENELYRLYNMYVMNEMFLFDYMNQMIAFGVITFDNVYCALI